MADSFSIASRSFHKGGRFSPYLTLSTEAQPLFCLRAIIPLCCGLVGTTLILSLTCLPLASKFLLSLVLGLAIYGTMVAYFQYMRLWLLLGLVSLTIFCLCHNAWGGHRYTTQSIVQSVAQAEALSDYFSRAEEYHLLRDELFVHKAYWKAHGGVLNAMELDQRSHDD